MSLYPITDYKKWAEMYSINTDPMKCPKCPQLLNLVTPMAIPNYRGLVVEICPACSYDSQMFRVVPISQDKLDLWNSIRPETKQ